MHTYIHAEGEVREGEWEGWKERKRGSTDGYTSQMAVKSRLKPETRSYLKVS